MWLTYIVKYDVVSITSEARKHIALQCRADGGSRYICKVSLQAAQIKEPSSTTTNVQFINQDCVTFLRIGSVAVIAVKDQGDIA